MFANEIIQAGTCIWKYDNTANVIEYDEAASKEYLKELHKKSLFEAQNFLDLTFGKGDKLVFITDDGRYFNHSDTPNCRTDIETGHTYTKVDIKVGDELFDNYETFSHPPFLFEMLDLYQCMPTYYNISNTTGEQKCRPMETDY